jgi:glutamate dehydrogenase
MVMFPTHEPQVVCMSAVIDALDDLDLRCTEVALHQYAGNFTSYNVYVAPKDPSMEETKIKHQLSTIIRLIYNMYVLPKTADDLPADMQPALKLYFGSASIFTYYFMPQTSEDFEALRTHLTASAPMELNRLNRLGRQMQKDAVGALRFAESVRRYPSLAHDIYKDFEKGRVPELSDSNTTKAGMNEALNTRIMHEVSDPLDQQILKCCLLFNANILKTNFFATKRAATAFRLDGSVVGKEFPEVPYGLFLVVGANFQGFHVRFRDIARGGIRMIRSPGGSYQKNLMSQLNENYNLAATQQLKNKDIPEGGSKGTILLNPGDAQNYPDESFKAFIDSLLDVIIANDEVVDKFGKEEILFFGPDEGTAGVMDWAAFHGQRRGYPFWKAITTGKPPTLGGIPHDTYGMTTRSVHQQVLGVLRVHNVKEEEVTKVQTGGPDGDLGSNEILMSKDKTIAVVDGAGVIFDPAGLDRAELTRLAKSRIMCDNFDTKKLGPLGYRVLVADKHVKLPNGEVVESGMAFRNTYHLHQDLTADLFVPCGGRPESVNINNVTKMFKKDGTPRFRFIVEGANLFITPDARRALEDQGVVLVKDATANKGGVTSSSMEVLAALALPEEDHNKLMCIQPDGSAPQFYNDYVKQLTEAIEEFARLEFEVCWREKQLDQSRYMFQISDLVSAKINNITDMMQASPLLDNEKFVKLVLAKSVPKKLQDHMGVDGIYGRVPKAYVKAMCSSYFASQYVYRYGLSGNEVDVLDFVQEFTSLVS